MGGGGERGFSGSVQMFQFFHLREKIGNFSYQRSIL